MKHADLKIAKMAEHDDWCLSRVQALDWSSCVGPGVALVRNDSLLYPCWMCLSKAEHIDNFNVRCTNSECCMSKSIVPREAWQNAAHRFHDCRLIYERDQRCKIR